MHEREEESAHVLVVADNTKGLARACCGTGSTREDHELLPDFEKHLDHRKAWGDPPRPDVVLASYVEQMKAASIDITLTDLLRVIGDVDVPEMRVTEGALYPETIPANCVVMRVLRRLQKVTTIESVEGRSSPIKWLWPRRITAHGSRRPATISIVSPTIEFEPLLATFRGVVANPK